MRGARFFPLVAFVAVACGACGAEPSRRARVTAAPKTAIAEEDAATDAPSDDPLDTLDELAERGTRLAPGMRELARAEGRAPIHTLVPLPDNDACVRVVFATREVIRATLSAAGETLATEEAGREGALGVRGPVCTRRGQALTLSFEAATPAAVRYVIWGTP
jgi:hypothetical protein